MLSVSIYFLSVQKDLFRDLVDPWALHFSLFLLDEFVLDAEGPLSSLAEGSVDALPGLSLSLSLTLSLSLSLDIFSLSLLSLTDKFSFRLYPLYSILLQISR